MVIHLKQGFTRAIEADMKYNITRTSTTFCAVYVDLKLSRLGVLNFGKQCKIYTFYSVKIYIDIQHAHANAVA